MSQDDKKNEIIRRPGDQLVRPSGSGSSLASRGLALLNQGKTKGIENAPPSPSPVHKVGDTITILLPGGVEMVFCYIPEGEFWMGSPEDEEDHNDDEYQHRVVLTKPFWMGMYQVTQVQWKSVMGSNPSHFKGRDLPVEQMTWDDCQEFLARLNAKGDGNIYRLPTEAEWEYACRAGTTGDYAGNLDAMGWYSENSGRKTHPVGQKQANAWGLCDMHGNVWEWCADWYDENYYQVSPENDPRGPSSGEYPVLRGGSWGNGAGCCRSANRLLSTPTLWSRDCGFRVVHSSRT